MIYVYDSWRQRERFYITQGAFILYHRKSPEKTSRESKKYDERKEKKVSFRCICIHTKLLAVEKDIIISLMIERFQSQASLLCEILNPIHCFVIPYLFRSSGGVRVKGHFACQAWIKVPIEGVSVLFMK